MSICRDDKGEHLTRRMFETWDAIDADDAMIEAALEKANIPALMVTLVHLTGDMSVIRGDIRPDSSHFGDPQAGITDEQQVLVRERALEAIAVFRDNGSVLPPAPKIDQIREMMNFIVGESLPPDYGDFLMSELALNGEDPYRQPGIEEIPQAKRDAFHVIIIGAGMSGILAAHRLKEAGISFTVIEKNPDVGGTWLENTYPGCRVDSTNHVYSYSFAPNDWPQHYSPQKVLLEYFERCASEFGIRDNIRFNSEVESAAFDFQSRTWRVVIKDRGDRRETLTANAVISAVGQLNRPRLPEIEGWETFKGISFHTARWQHEHDLTGRRIAVIGTGASAFQLVPEIAKQAGEVFVFQRNPPWIVMRPDYHDDVPEGKHWLLNNVPVYAKWFRFLMFWRTAEGLLAWVHKDTDWPDQTRSVSAKNDELRELLTKNIEQIVGDDPELFERCVPQYPPAGKRMLFDNGTWLRALKRDNVHVCTDPIIEITESGLVTECGDRYNVDLIIYATGFHASRILWPMKVSGLLGVDLQRHWDGDPRAYKGITIPGFPNFFCMYGPNTNIVINGSIIFFSECEMRYILGCIKLLLETDHAAMDCRQNVHDEYNAWIDEGNLNMAWGAPTVTSWYKNSRGRVTQNWPFTLLKYWTQTRAPNPADYIFMD